MWAKNYLKGKVYRFKKLHILKNFIREKSKIMNTWKYNWKLRNIGTAVLAVATFGSTLVMPLAANAGQSSDASRHRQQTKNTWRNATIGAGALGVLGLATHNTTLGVAGLAGAAYSASRYEHDRKSQAHIDHERRRLHRRRHHKG